MTLYLLDLTGVAVFAASGVLAAGRKGLDLVGVTAVAAVTAVGGGTLRDLLLDRHPIFWIDDPAYLAVIIAAVPATILLARLRLLPARPLAVADALGLALFTIIGTRIADAAGLPWPAVLLMGTMTGTAGGVFRDVLTNEVPIILQPGELYATAAIAGAAADVLLRHFGVPPFVAVMTGATIIALLRLISVYRKWHLPAIRLDASGNGSHGSSPRVEPE